jgi:hypothetical protein
MADETNLFNGESADLGHGRPGGSRPRPVSRGPSARGWDAFGWEAFTYSNPQTRLKLTVTSFHRPRRIR